MTEKYVTMIFNSDVSRHLAGYKLFTKFIDTTSVVEVYLK